MIHKGFGEPKVIFFMISVFKSFYYKNHKAKTQRIQGSYVLVIGEWSTENKAAGISGRFVEEVGRYQTIRWDLCSGRQHGIAPLLCG